MSVEQLVPKVATESEMSVDTLRHEAGLSIYNVRVPDGYESRKYAIQRSVVQEALGSYENYLRNHEDVTYDSEHNPARKFLDSIPAVAAWKTLMPSAMALYPLQRPETNLLPNGVKVDKLTREMFRHCLDAIGIRSRAKVMEQLMLSHVNENEKGQYEWLSLACGAAVPVLDTLQMIQKQNPESNYNLSLVDIDETALGFAAQLAREQGLEEGVDFTAKKSDLIRGLILGDSLIDELGEESKDMVDMLGIFEYFDDRRAAGMLRNAYRLVKPGGSLIIGNMLKSHPNMRINQAAVGWPKIKPRTVEELAGVIGTSGIPLDECNVFIPEDGVYAIVEIRRSEKGEHTQAVSQLGANALSMLNN